MRLGKLVKYVARRWGLTVFRDLPRGIDLYHDLKFSFPRHAFETILDVGANVGQSARSMAAAFPGSRIHSFEPASDTFELLRRNTASLRQVSCHRLALGDTPGSGSLLRTESLTMRYLQAEGAAGEEGFETEMVTVTTLDAFCREAEIDRIDFLKIDAEGFDLKVLRGGKGMLREQRIAVLQCEVGVDPDNDFHCAFDDVRDELFPLGYRLFGFYQQKPRETEAVRRVNAAFASQTLLSAYPRAHLFDSPTKRSASAS